MWKVAEVQFGALEKTLNAIEADGGKVYTVIDGSGTRKDHVLVIWKTAPVT
jgi:hypothetical protein